MDWDFFLIDNIEDKEVVFGNPTIAQLLKIWILEQWEDERVRFELVDLFDELF